MSLASLSLSYRDYLVLETDEYILSSLATDRMKPLYTKVRKLAKVDTTAINSPNCDKLLRLDVEFEHIEFSAKSYIETFG